MIYYLKNKDRGILTDGTPTVVPPGGFLPIVLNFVPTNASLYISDGKKTKSISLTDDDGCNIEYEAIDLIVGNKEVISADIKVITNKSPYRVWHLDELYIRRLKSGEFLCYADCERLRMTVADLERRLGIAEQSIKNNADRLDYFDKVFDGNFITE